MFILKRTGWSQFLDYGDCWRESQDMAREFATREEAEEKKQSMIEGTDFDDDDILIIART